MPQSYTKRGGKAFSVRHGVAIQRKFGGVNYNAETSTRKKSRAEEIAKGFRVQGYKARVVKANKSGSYIIYLKFGRKNR